MNCRPLVGTGLATGAIVVAPHPVASGWWRTVACWLPALLLAACSSTPASPAPPRQIELLVMTGCEATAPLRQSLDLALHQLGWPVRYVVIDQASLPTADRRRGFGAPTILCEGIDLFGQLPGPPLPAPT